MDAVGRYNGFRRDERVQQGREFTRIQFGELISGTVQADRQTEPCDVDRAVCIAYRRQADATVGAQPTRRAGEV